MTEPAKLAIRDLHKSFGALRVTQGVNVEVRMGELHALIGPNGAGKTTLLSQISGEMLPDSGSIVLDGRDITQMPAQDRPAAGLARSFQISQVYPEFTVEDNVAMAVQAHTPGSFNMWRDARRDARLREPARAAIQRVGLAHQINERVANLAHGEKRQLELAMALSLNASLLLLDEPMAGMGPDESGRLVELLESLRGEVTLLLVEHDMDAVFRLADTVSTLVSGRVVASGTPAQIRANPEVRRAYLGDELPEEA